MVFFGIRTVRPAEFLTIIGQSGCGKSTLLNLIAGFEQVSAGSIEFDGKPVTRPGPDRGVVFQEYALFPWLTVYQNIAFGLRELRVPTPERHAAIALVLVTDPKRWMSHLLHSMHRHAV